MIAAWLASTNTWISSYKWLRQFARRDRLLCVHRMRLSPICTFDGTRRDATRHANTRRARHHKILTTHFFTHSRREWSFPIKKKRYTSLTRRNCRYMFCKWIATGQLVVAPPLLCHRKPRCGKGKGGGIVQYFPWEKRKRICVTSLQSQNHTQVEMWVIRVIIICFNTRRTGVYAWHSSDNDNNSLWKLYYRIERILNNERSESRWKIFIGQMSYAKLWEKNILVIFRSFK